MGTNSTSNKVDDRVEVRAVLLSHLQTCGVIILLQLEPVVAVESVKCTNCAVHSCLCEFSCLVPVFHGDPGKGLNYKYFVHVTSKNMMSKQKSNYSLVLFVVKN